MNGPTGMTLELARSLYSYDPQTGLLYWKVDRNNKTKAGDIAGFNKTNDYTFVTHRKHYYLAHRIMWALFYGEWPDKCIDHINGNKHDNRIVNLRLATVAENCRNRSSQKNNHSGFKGVSFSKSKGKFIAKIKADRKAYHLGTFSTAEEASIAYRAAAKILHKEFNGVRLSR